MAPSLSFMEAALREARAAGEIGEVPVGAVVTHRGAIVASAGNRTFADCDPTAHAEIVALRRAALTLGTARLPECDLYVTLEPCAMCAGAISMARIRRLYFGALDPKGGAVESGVRLFHAATTHHAPDVYGGLCEGEAGRLLKDFFLARRPG